MQLSLNRRVARSLFALFSSLLALLAAPGSTRGAALPDAHQQAGWQQLTPQAEVYPGGAFYYRLSAGNGSRVHLIVVDVRSGKWDIKPVVNRPMASTSTTANRCGASAAINGGFFSFKNGESVGYVVVDAKTVCDPSPRSGELTSSQRQAHKILNRSELRYLIDAGGRPDLQIANHEDPVPPGCKLVHSLQAGPRLLPALTLGEEAFIRRAASGVWVDAIRSSQAAARTAIGITADGHALIACVDCGAGSPGMTLKQLADLFKKLGCTEAINLDGGGSTTMYVRFQGAGGNALRGRVVTGNLSERAVATVLLIEPVKP